jgi:hypothetical protein
MSENTDGDQQNFAAFLLTVGSVTAVFLCVFLLAFPEPIGMYFAVGVIGVTAITMVFGIILNMLSHFDGEQTNESDETHTATVEHERAKQNQPLPKKVNFTSELRQLREHFGGELPKQAESFVEEYERFKSSKKNRKAIAGSLRAAMNPLHPLVSGDEEMEELVEEMGDRLFEYINSTPTQNISITSYGFYTDGNKASIEDLAGGSARIIAQVHNEGETSKVEVGVEFDNKDGVTVRSITSPVGVVANDATKELNTKISVPSIATTARVFPVKATEDTEVLDM